MMRTMCLLYGAAIITWPPWIETTCDDLPLLFQLMEEEFSIHAK